MVQEYDRETKQHIYGQELWTDIRPGSAHQDYGTGEMEFRVRKPQESKLIFAVMNIEEQRLDYRFCGELRMNVGKLVPGAFAVRDTFPLDASVYFPQRKVTGDITVAIKFVPGAPSVRPPGTFQQSEPKPLPLPPLQQLPIEAQPQLAQQAPPPPSSGGYFLQPGSQPGPSEPGSRPGTWVRPHPNDARVAPANTLNGLNPPPDQFPAPTPIPAPTPMASPPEPEKAPEPEPRAKPKPVPATQEYVDASYQNIVPNFGEPKLAENAAAVESGQQQPRPPPTATQGSQPDGWWDPFGWFSPDRKMRA